MAAVDPASVVDPLDPRVVVRGVTHYFGSGENRKSGLTENNLTLMPGELVIMTGPSGSGKTTLLTLIGALRTLQHGSLQVMGQELYNLGPGELAKVRRDIGFIFQAHNLFESLTALQNVRIAMELHKHAPAEMKRVAIEMLSRLGLAERIHYKPKHLSGGQRQRVAIARALANRPQLVLADEPTAALDKDSGAEVMKIFKELAASEGCTVLLVTHDSRIIDVADRIVSMVDGHIVKEILVEETVTICEFLAQCPIFQPEAAVPAASQGAEDRYELTFSNSPALLTEVAQKMRKEKYPRGSEIVRQGALGDTFFIIRTGQVDVQREEDGTITTLSTLTTGDYFGETSLLRDQPRNATVVATQETVVYSLSKQDFLAAVEASGSLPTQLRRTMFQS